jgi:hypothetical protein
MCKKRELTEKSIIEEVHRPIGERSIQTLMRKQLELIALTNTVTTTLDTEEGKLACQRLVSTMMELKDMNAMCTCGLN